VGTRERTLGFSRKLNRKFYNTLKAEVSEGDPSKEFLVSSFEFLFSSFSELHTMRKDIPVQSATDIQYTSNI